MLESIQEVKKITSSVIRYFEHENKYAFANFCVFFMYLVFCKFIK